MAGFENDVLLCSNVNFNPALPKPHTGLITTNGQLIIGSTALNAGGTHLNIGVLTSPDGSITIGYSSPNITLQATGSLPYISISPFIVGTDIHSGYSTIQAAINAAQTAGATKNTPANVYIKPKSDLSSYTEDLTIPDGVNLISFDGVVYPNSGSSVYGNTLAVRIDGKINFVSSNQVNRFENIYFLATGKDNFDININVRLEFLNCYVVTANGFAAFKPSAVRTLTVNCVDSLFTGLQMFDDNGVQCAASFFYQGCTISGAYTATNAATTLYVQGFESTLSRGYTCNCNTVGVHMEGGSVGIANWTFSGATVATIYLSKLTSSQFPTITSVAATSSLQMIDCQFTTTTITLPSSVIINPSTFRDASKGWKLRDQSNSLGISSIGFTEANLITKQAVLQTTSGAAQTLATIAVAAGTAMTIKGIITGANAGHTDITGGSYEVVVDGTAAAIVGSASLNVQASTTGTFAVSFSGGNLLVQVTAPSAAAYNWATTYQIQPMVSNA